MYEDYQVVRAESVQELEEEVNRKIAEGYIPIGGMAISVSAFYQAVARFCWKK